jgi:tRNA(adenine34) deaminase
VSEGAVEHAARAWTALTEPWQVAFSLAWEAYGAGTIPVGAALANGEGAIVGRGRNRVYEPDGPPGQLANSLLAHAEVNALVGLDPAPRYEDHVLYTTLEPCVLCVGATVMATVGRIRYAGADPFAGGDGWLVEGNAHLAGVPLELDGPCTDPFGTLGSVLLLAFFLRRNPSGHVVRAYAEKAAPLTQVAQAMIAAGAPEAAAAGVPLVDALAGFWPALVGRS